MVDTKKIQRLLKKQFLIDKYTINPHTGAVSTNGIASLEIMTPQLMVIFDHVGASFSCAGRGLTSLKGAPAHVGGNFYCISNKLTSLIGAPSHVGGKFYCNSNKLTSLIGAPSHVGENFDCRNNPLTTLEGAPAHVGGSVYIGYDKHLPLLRALVYNRVQLVSAPVLVSKIMNKYAGQGKAAALNCALELKKAGYVENAKW